MNIALDHLQRALDFSDRALDQLKSEDPDLEDVMVLVEGVRTELTALLNLEEGGVPQR